MIKLSNSSEFLAEVKKEKLLSPEKLATKGYGLLQFECGCGALHGVNDRNIEILGTSFPVKILFRCNKNITKVQIKGFFKQKCISLWTLENELITEEDLATSLKHI